MSPRFWTGPTGKRIRAMGCEAQVVAIYLMTAPTATMAGLYYLPLPVLAHETGIPFEGASKALLRLSEAGFCSYDPDEEVIWVPEMARHQIGDELKPRDHRVAGLMSALDPYKSCAFIGDFVEKYGVAFSLPPEALAWASQAPSKPLRSQDQEQEQEQEQDQEYLPRRGAAAGTGEVNVEAVEARAKRVRQQPTGDHAALIAEFDRLYAEAHGGARPTWDAKRGAQVAKLLKAHGLEECSKRAANMFRSPPPWPPPPHDLGTLVQHFDRFAQPHRADARVGHFRVTGDEVYAGREVEF